MWVLGINGPPIGWHDVAACLVSDGVVHAFSEEERFSRVKHAVRQNPTGSVSFCLDHAGITMDDVDVVAIGWNLPKILPRFGGAWTDRSALEWLERYLDWKPSGAGPEFVLVDHHMAHAASGFYASPFERAGVLVNDGNGEEESISVYDASYDGGIKCLRQWPRSHSLGYLYDAASRGCGLDFLEAGKTMGLAAYGWAAGREPWPLLRFDDDLFQPPFTFDASADYAEIVPAWSEVFDRFATFPVKTPTGLLDADVDAVQLAWSAQASVEEAVARLAAYTRAETGVEALCMAGGVALNCSANGKLAEPLYVPPVPHDAGVALGAAWYVSPPTAPGAPFSPYQGSPLDVDDVIGELQTKDASPEAVADRLARGLVGAIAHGRAEVGPRALCHRSLLAVPSSTAVRDDVNDRKGRERWRPLSPVATASSAGSRWENRPFLHRYMLGASQVSDAAKEEVPAVVHVDGTARVQLIEDDEPVAGYLHALEAAGLPPVLINTSFNARGEPVVDTAEQALATARGIGVDFLVLDDVLVDLPPKAR